MWNINTKVSLLLKLNGLNCTFGPTNNSSSWPLLHRDSQPVTPQVGHSTNERGHKKINGVAKNKNHNPASQIPMLLLFAWFSACEILDDLTLLRLGGLFKWHEVNTRDKRRDKQTMLCLKGAHAKRADNRCHRGQRRQIFTWESLYSKNNSINQVSELLQSQSLSVDEPINRLIA